MKNKVVELLNNEYFKILECCVLKKDSTRSELAQYAGIKEHSNYLYHLTEAKLIKVTDPNVNTFFSITPEGMSAYLNLQFQKRANKHSQIAIYIAIASFIISFGALVINILLIIN